MSKVRQNITRPHKAAMHRWEARCTTRKGQEQPGLTLQHLQSPWTPASPLLRCFPEVRVLDRMICARGNIPGIFFRHVVAEGSRAYSLVYTYGWGITSRYARSLLSQIGGLTGKRVAYDKQTAAVMNSTLGKRTQPTVTGTLRLGLS
jgi:hypothetical protein